MDHLSIKRQMEFIVNNAKILDKQTKINILGIIMMEIGPSVILKSSNGSDININLDAVADCNEEVLTNIYNIVNNRRDSLNKPVITFDRQA